MKWKDDYVSEAVGNTLMSGWNYAGAMFAISAGDSRSSRDGNKVWSIGCKYHVTFWNPSTVNIVCRMLALQVRIKYDNSIPVGGPGVALLFDTDGSGFPLTSYTEPQRLINPLNKRHFRVLLDKRFTLQSTSAADSRRSIIKTGYVKTRSRLTWDPQISATTPDFPVYFLWIFSRSDSDTTVGDTVELSWMIRHHFKDI